MARPAESWVPELVAGEWVVRRGNRRLLTGQGLGRNDATLVARRLNRLEALVARAWEAS